MASNGNPFARGASGDRRLPERISRFTVESVERGPDTLATTMSAMIRRPYDRCVPRHPLGKRPSPGSMALHAWVFQPHVAEEATTGG